MILKYTITEPYDGKTVKQVLKNHFKLSERLIKKLKYNRIFLNSIPVFINERVHFDDVLEVNIEFDEDNSNIIPEDIEIDIIYEDNELIAINKKPGIVVHPTINHPSGTIANALAFYLGKKGINVKVRPVNRLDRDTSGIIIFALNQYVQDLLIRQMKNNIFEKEYIGIVHGTPRPLCGTINLPIDRKPGSIMLREVSDRGYPSVTHYQVIEEFNEYSLLKFSLETGRTHQIRVHCRAIGHPLLGDTLYSDFSTDLIGRQALHSNRIRFLHPLTNRFLELNSPLPDDMAKVLEILRK